VPTSLRPAIAAMNMAAAAAHPHNANRSNLRMVKVGLAATLRGVTLMNCARVSMRQLRPFQANH
jgi:hypothetical protein